MAFSARRTARAPISWESWMSYRARTFPIGRRRPGLRGLLTTLTVLASLCAAGRSAAGAPASSKSGKASAAQELSPLERRRKLALDYLTKLYGDRFSSSDWIARAAAVIGLSRMPTDEATRMILERTKSERHAVGRLVAWQAALGRAPMLDREQYAAWQTCTWQMVKNGLFHGDLRIGLLEMVSAAPVTAEGRNLFKDLFRRTNSLDSSDIPTLIAMGHALRRWGDAELVEMLIGALGSPSSVVRAELVLQAAGVGVDWNRTPEAKGVYSQWWKENKERFTGRAGGGAGGWKKLRPQYIPGPLAMSKFDPADKKWRDEMELDRLQLGHFGFAMAIDCSRSMRGEIDRLKRDMRIMFAAFQMIAREVGVGVTKFAPGQIVKCLPLTGDIGRLMAYVQAADILGPAGEEEWAGALAVTIKASRWPRPGKYSRRAIVLMSDEPITDPQQARAMRIAKDAAKEGFRIYGVRVWAHQNAAKNPLSIPFDRTTGGSVFAEDPAGAGRAGRGRGNPQRKGGRSWGYYDDLAKATGGRAIDVEVPQGGVGLGIIARPRPKPTANKPKGGGGNRNAGGGKGGKGRGGKNKPGRGRKGAVGVWGAKGQAGGRQGARGGAVMGGMDIAPIYPGGGPTSRILTLVLTDAINPYHANRIEPLVKILVAYCQKAAPRQRESRTWCPPGRMPPNRARRGR